MRGTEGKGRRIDKGMAGYATDSDLQSWRSARHPLRYDPPRIADDVKTVACAAAMVLAFIVLMWSVDLLIPSWWW